MFRCFSRNSQKRSEQEQKKFLVVNSLQPIDGIIQAMTEKNIPFEVTTLSQDAKSFIINDSPGKEPDISLRVLPSLYNSAAEAVRALLTHNHHSRQNILFKPFILTITGTQDSVITENTFQHFKIKPDEIFVYDFEKDDLCALRTSIAKKFG